MEEFVSALLSQGGPSALIAGVLGTLIFLLFRFITAQTERNEARNDQLRDGYDKLADTVSTVSNTVSLVLHTVEGLDSIRDDARAAKAAVEEATRAMARVEQAVHDLQRDLRPR